MTKFEWTNCEICGADKWQVDYCGKLRIGAFGNFIDAVVKRCGCCGTGRLDENVCTQPEDYSSGTYRHQLGQSGEALDFLREHDCLQQFTLNAFDGLNLRNKTVLDIGCGGGSLLDHVSGLASRCVAVEPAMHYHESLRGRGYEVYSWPADAAASLQESIDVVFCIQVIEHLVDPIATLRSAYETLKSGGTMIVSTPNRRDMLLDILPESYAPFFYRAAHRWYFDADSLAHAGRAAGFEVSGLRFVQRYSLSNFLLWLRDRKPSGEARLAGLDTPVIEAMWAAHLEATGRSDAVYIRLKRPL